MVDDKLVGCFASGIGPGRDASERQRPFPAVAPAAVTGFMRRSGTRRRKWNVFPYAAVLPAAVLVLGLLLVPILATIYHSFTNWDGLTSTFIGVKNFLLIFRDPLVYQVFLNSVIFLISVPLIVAASLFAAVLVHERVRGWRTFRFLFFIPNVLSPVIVGVLFGTFFLPGNVVDTVLSPIGLGHYAWLSNPWTARAVVILALVWASFGLGMVIILSAMASIDPALYDAAAIDGASWWKRLRLVTIPMISGSLQFLSVINIIYTFTSLFGFIFVITSGGPGFSTTTVDYFTYITTFENGQFGYGAALALLLFLIVLGLTILQMKLLPRRELAAGN